MIFNFLLKQTRISYMIKLKFLLNKDIIQRNTIVTLYIGGVVGYKSLRSLTKR